LEALVEGNAEVVTEEIVEITESGLRSKDGKFYEVDVIVCATGFNTSFVPNFSVVGNVTYLWFINVRSQWNKFARRLER
jgi:cation diffusion facilitator CzcD-associated flavoprotein CzcO